MNSKIIKIILNLSCNPKAVWDFTVDIKPLKNESNEINQDCEIIINTQTLR